MFLKKTVSLILLLLIKVSFLNGMQHTQLLRGLPNGKQGEENNCFINSTLQCLQNLNGFAASVEHNAKKNNVLNNLSNLLSSHDVFDDHLFYQSVRKNLFKNMAKTQEDPIEFIEKLIDSHHDFEKTIQNLTKINIESQKTCTQCNHSTFNQSYDYILKCEIPEKNMCSLEDCLKSFSEHEFIYAKCEYCSKNKDIECTKQLSFHPAADHFMIAAKIYDNNLQKKEVSISFPLQLNLEADMYHLKGLILHVGDTLKAGHYIAIIQNGNQWYLCNDDTIETLTDEEVQDISNYGDMCSKSNFFDTFVPYIWFYSKDGEFDKQIALQTKDFDTLYKNIYPIEKTKYPKKSNPLTNEIHQILQDSSQIFFIQDSPTISRNNKANDEICRVEYCSQIEPFNSAEELYNHLATMHLLKNNNGQFTCMWKHCNKPFQSRAHLKRHIIIHTDHKPLKCTKGACDFTCRIKENLTQHLKICTGKPSQKTPQKACHMKKCPQKEPFDSDEQLYNHLLEKHSSKNTNPPFSCMWKNCNKKFERKDSFERHLITHTNYKPYTCTIQTCNHSYNDKSNYMKHMKKVHSIVSKKGGNQKSEDKACHMKDCPQTKPFDSDEQLYKHPIEKHFLKTKDQKFHCMWENCNKIFKSHPKKHLITHTNYKPYACDIKTCDHAYNDKENYIKQMKNVHNINPTNKNIKISDKTCLMKNCPQTKPFDSDEQLYNHLLEKHSSKNTNTPFFCMWKNCNKKFERKDSFERHLITHTNHKLYVCKEPACDHSYNDKKSYMQHMEKFHSITLNKKKNKKFSDKACHMQVCSQTKPFDSDEQLYNHLLEKHCSHIKNEKAICMWEDCNKMFKLKSDLKRHLITHTNHKLYTCTIGECDFSCNSSQAFNKHCTTCKGIKKKLKKK